MTFQSISIPSNFTISANSSWSSQPKVVLALVASCGSNAKYYADITVTDSKGNTITPTKGGSSWDVASSKSPLTDAQAAYVARYASSSVNLPFTISGTIYSSGSNLRVFDSESVSLGTDNNTSVAFQSTLTVGDGNDNDYDDLVLNFQLFNQSADS